jgi:steroid 5-alpha reductase family enzyme
MSWWEREGGNVVAIIAAFAAGIIVWTISQWISDEAWADFAGAGVATVAVFWLLHRSVRATQRPTYRRVPPWLAR